MRKRVANRKGKGPRKAVAGMSLNDTFGYLMHSLVNYRPACKAVLNSEVLYVHS